MVKNLDLKINHFLKKLIFVSGNSNQHQQSAEENRQAIMLFAIVALFFVCHILRNFLSLYEALTFEQKKEDYFHNCGGVALWVLVIGLISHFLLSCNSALNFFLYCVMSEQFRCELKKLFGGNNSSAPHSIQNSPETHQQTELSIFPKERQKDCDNTLTTSV